jgi:membrane protease YdiL (CAAX protease family)
LLFGFVHVFNYAGDNPAALLPFILPQLVGGVIWGYARIRYGWWSNIVMHMGYNLVATSGLIYILLTVPNPS